MSGEVSDHADTIRRVAALFVDPNGVYANLPDVEVWDEARDARLYDGPWPVVAHPPCARWSIMGNCRPEYEKGADGGCFAAALEAARRFGGVIEHPRHTLAWRHFGLPRPLGAYGWTRTLMDECWTTEVDQRLYGHPCPKPTWLAYFGPEPPELRWGAADRGELSTRGGRRGYGPHKSTHNNHHMRAATPPAFRDVLLDMARRAARVSLGEKP